MVLRMEDNLSPYLTMVETAEPTAPDAGQQRLYVDPVTHLLMIVDSTGAQSSVAGSAVTRASLGLATSDTPQFTGIEVGHASDTTLARSAAGILTVEGNRLFAVGGADVPIADGGTGASTATAAFDALSPMTTAGDIIIGGASGTRTRLAAGSTSGHVLTSNGAGVAPSYQAAGGGSLTTSYQAATADTSLSAATIADLTGATLTLAAGTWFISCLAMFNPGGGTTLGYAILELTDGSNNIIGIARQFTSTLGSANSVSVAIPSQPVVLGGSTTVKLRGLTQEASTAEKNASSASGPTTYISAIKVA